MTKEDILDKADDNNPYDIGDDTVTKKAAYEAMDEHAKGFGQWLQDNYWCDTRGFYQHDYQISIYREIPELYNLYLQSKNK